jgi:periplasmic divalent cation tolerance protein
MALHESPAFVQVVTTTDSAEAAAALARSAVEARLAACAQVEGPVDSVYWWEDMVDTAKEWRVTFKTTAVRSVALVEHITAQHTYDVPEVLVTPVLGGHEAYLDWLQAETRPHD